MGYIKAITHSLNQNEEQEKSKRPERMFGCVLNLQGRIQELSGGGLEGVHKSEETQARDRGLL